MLNLETKFLVGDSVSWLLLSALFRRSRFDLKKRDDSSEGDEVTLGDGVLSKAFSSSTESNL